MMIIIIITITKINIKMNMIIYQLIPPPLDSAPGASRVPLPNTPSMCLCVLSLLLSFIMIVIMIIISSSSIIIIIIIVIIIIIIIMLLLLSSLPLLLLNPKP